jgi:hypothetical protein
MLIITLTFAMMLIILFFRIITIYHRALALQRIAIYLLLYSGVLVSYIFYTGLIGRGVGGMDCLFQVTIDCLIEIVYKGFPLLITSFYLDAFLEPVNWYSILNFIEGDNLSLDVFSFALVIYGPGFVTFPDELSARKFNKQAVRRANKEASKRKKHSSSNDSNLGQACCSTENCKIACNGTCRQQCPTNCSNNECSNGCAQKCASGCQWKCSETCFLLKYLDFRSWLTGFTDGEGCFYFNVIADKGMRLKERVAITFKITQNFRDIQLLYMIKVFFNCGYVYNSGDGKGTYNFEVKNFADLQNIIIPFFAQNHLLTKKYLDFQDFKTVAEMRANNEHLTVEGLKTIKTMALNTNKTRVFPFTKRPSNN